MKTFRSIFLGALVVLAAVLFSGSPVSAEAQTSVPAYTTVVADAWSDWYWDCGWWDYHYDYDWWWGPGWYYGFGWYSGHDWTWTPSWWWYDYLYYYQCYWVWVEIYGTSLVQVPNTNGSCTYNITVNFSDGSSQNFTQQGNGGAINLYFTHSATDPTPTGVTAIEQCPFAIYTEALAQSPADRQRKRLGVGELVSLSITPAPAGEVHWAIQGAGSLSEHGGPNALFEAGDIASVTTITATVGSSHGSVTFQVVQPSGVYMIRTPETGVRHVQGVPSSGFKADYYLLPSDVSFSRVSTAEGSTVATTWGYFAPSNGVVHVPGDWAPMSHHVEGVGTKAHLFDQVYHEGAPEWPLADGYFSWPIPWSYRVDGGPSYPITTVYQLAAADLTGTMMPSKAGAVSISQLNDPTSDW